ncbi:DUF6344 domain-containing protein [Streptomyces sp. NPDC001606]
MTQNKVMKLWTAIVTAFLALCTALGLASATTATAAAATPRTENTGTGTSTATKTATRTVPTIPAPRHWAWSHGKALPPTMKQRIRAEAHGKTPRCRRRGLPGTQENAQDDPQEPAHPSATGTGHRTDDQRSAPLAC